MIETATKWKIRFKRKGGYFSFDTIKRRRSFVDISRSEAREWAENKMRNNPSIIGIDEIYPEKD